MTIINTIIKTITNILINTFVILIWDTALSILNLLTPALKPGTIIPLPSSGHNLSWPPYTPPGEGDSRSACPMLNALANHGILPHDGKSISFRELTTVVRSTFNFASSFCFFVPNFSAGFLGRSYWRDRFDLAELSLHADNAIEHDASLTREDVALVPDQSRPDSGLVRELLGEATGRMGDGSSRLTISDLSRALSRRRVDARRKNKDYSESWFHNLFGSANSSTMLTIFGGRIDDLTIMLTEERFPERWEPRVRARYGLTMGRFNWTVVPVEMGVDTKRIEREERELGVVQAE